MEWRTPGVGERMEVGSGGRRQGQSTNTHAAAAVTAT